MSDDIQKQDAPQAVPDLPMRRLHKRNADVGPEMIEMMGFTKELREIGRNCVDEAF